MEMTKKLTQSINDADVPIFLKDYLLRNRQIPTFFTSDLLAAIEDVYVEYDSLYFFDKVEFSAHIITEIRNDNQYDSDYNSLKRAIESKLEVSSKHKTSQEKDLKESNKDIVIPVTEKKIKDLMADTYELTAKYQAGKTFKNIYNFSTINQRLGVLIVFNSFYPDNPFQESFNEIEDIIYNLPIDDSDVAKHKKMLHDK